MQRLFSLRYLFRCIRHNAALFLNAKSLRIRKEARGEQKPQQSIYATYYYANLCSRMFRKSLIKLLGNVNYLWHINIDGGFLVFLVSLRQDFARTVSRLVGISAPRDAVRGVTVLVR